MLAHEGIYDIQRLRGLQDHTTQVVFLRSYLECPEASARQVHCHHGQLSTIKFQDASAQYIGCVKKVEMPMNIHPEEDKALGKENSL